MTDGSGPGKGPQTPVRRHAAGAPGEMVGRGAGSLGPLLAWAIAFADLGTSVYYVPGILFGQVGGLAPAFVLVTTLVFVLVAHEHLEVAHRYPTGGGGIAAAVEAFGPRVGVVSGALMISAFLIAIALTVVTAMNYIAVLRPRWPHDVLVLSIGAILLLGLLSWVGVRVLARLTLVGSIAALAAHGALLFAVVTRLQPSDWAELFSNVRRISDVGWAEAATGFAAAWLAYSGLEALGQLAPALKEPRRKVIRIASALVIGSVLITVPLFTAVAVEAAAAHGIAPQGALMAAVALDYGGRELQLAVALTGAFLLLMAAKVAFVGCYNVFQALGEHGYLPAAVAKGHSREDTPRGAVVVVTLGALLLVMGTDGDSTTLAELFAFGLLGSYTITSVSLDVLRLRERRFGVFFVLGIIASIALAVPWVTSWVTKWKATAYGAFVTGSLLSVAFVTRRGWIRSGRFGFLRATAAEQSAAELSSAVEVLTLVEAQELKSSYPSTTMIAVRSANPALCREAARRARGAGDSAVYVVFVDEIPGFLFPPRTGPSSEALRVLQASVNEIRAVGMDAIPVWRLAHDAGGSLAEAAEELGVTCIFIGTTQRSAVTHFLQGSVLKQLLSGLPEQIRVVICE